jgi:dihydroorotase-like cyclic amidohydrolase
VSGGSLRRSGSRAAAVPFGRPGAKTLGSDHAPHTVEEKNRPPADAPPGLPGVQELASPVWTGLRTGGPIRTGPPRTRPG